MTERIEPPRCTTCDLPTRAGALFCGGCGTRIEGTDTGERRWVAALFCDLVESTDLSRRLGPELFAGVIAEYQAIVDDVVSSSGGRVVQLLGDGALALFGWPVTRDDDVERALHAAVTVVKQVAAAELPGGVTLATRVGVHAGSVIVRPDTTGTGNAPVTGAPLKIAARIQELATPNSVITTAQDVSAAPGMFVSRPARLRRAAPADLESLELVEVLRRGSPGTNEGDDDLPLVARDHEVRRLEDLFERSRDGRGTVAFLHGPAGIGKSRTLRSLRARLHQTPHTWIDVRAAPSDDRALGPLVDLVRSGLGHDPTFDQIVASMDLPGLDPSVDAPVIARLLGIEAPDTTPSAGAADLVGMVGSTLLRWLASIASDQVAVVVIENLQWADMATLDVVRALTTVVADLPILAVCTSREMTRPFDADDGSGTVVHLPLVPLRPAMARALHDEVVRSITRGGPSPIEDAAAESIVLRAEGNPLFVIELTRDAIEGRDPLAELQQPPDNVRRPLGDRLERLGTAKRLLQCAAVVGREFDTSLLGALSGRSPDLLHAELQVLTARRLVEPMGDDGDRFRFSSLLTRDLAYESILDRDRRWLHGRVAQLLQPLVDRDPAIVARHLARSDDPAAAGDHYLDAIRRAKERGLHDEVLNLALRALEDAAPGAELRTLTEQQELEVRLHAIPSYWYRLDFMLPQLSPHMDRVVELAERHGDAATAAEARAHAAYAAISLGRPDRADLVRAAVEAATVDELHDHPARAWGAVVDAYDALVCGRYRHAVMAARSVEVDVDAPTSSWLIWGWADLQMATDGFGAAATAILGEFDEMDRHLDRIRHLEPMGRDLAGSTTTHMLAAMGLLIAGRTADAAAWIDAAQGPRLVREMSTTSRMFDAVAGSIQLFDGDLDGAATVQSALDGLASTGQVGGSSVFLSIAAFGLARLGHTGLASEYANLALSLSDVGGTAMLELAEGALAVSETLAGDTEAATRRLRRARASAAASGATTVERLLATIEPAVPASPIRVG